MSYYSQLKKSTLSFFHFYYPIFYLLFIACYSKADETESDKGKKGGSLMSDLEQQLAKYAELIVRSGVNVQQGQDVCISGSIETAPLVRFIAQKAYEAGARNVYLDWHDDALTRLQFEQAAEDVFSQFPAWDSLKRNTLVNKGAAFISIVSSNPDILAGIDPQRISNHQKASGQALEHFRRCIQANKVTWTVVAAASHAWAKKVFPHLSADEAVMQLWTTIFTFVRLDSPNPLQAWTQHHETLHKKMEQLNKKRFHKLHYRAPGTDLTIELPAKHLWVGAGSVNEQQIPFIANMPTEEVFTVPHKFGVNGYVSSTKPLSYGGNVIHHFTLTFANGRIVKVDAEQGKEILHHLIATDEGAHYLGEVALVPQQSPISQSNLLFYNTLFDENASHHLAIGSGYAFNVEGGTTMSTEELAACGVNTSITHVDFMIGSAEMNIDGIDKNGNCEPIFRQGNWAL